MRRPDGVNAHQLPGSILVFPAAFNHQMRTVTNTMAQPGDGVSRKAYAPIVEAMVAQALAGTKEGNTPAQATVSTRERPTQARRQEHGQERWKANR